MASSDGTIAENTLELQIQVPEDVQRGSYANQFISTHTPEEFILDFILASPPAGVVNARVLVSPAHAKRIATALLENIARYEAVFGEISPLMPMPVQEHHIKH